MSYVLAFLRWLFGRRLSADARYRAWALETVTWIVEDLTRWGLDLADPRERARIVDDLRKVEEAAFWWSPRRCGALRRWMAAPLSEETIRHRLRETMDVLLGARTMARLGKGWKMRKGRKFLHRKKLVAWRAKRRVFAGGCADAAARDPPLPPPLPRPRRQASAP